MISLQLTAKVIQGWFVGGRPKLATSVQPKLILPSIQTRMARPSVSAFASRAGAVQRHGAEDAFAVEAGRLGLAPSGGGRPLPEAVRGQMEAALGADFSNVRVHVGPQAERIGAIAFTVGSDIYFAPSRYQPDTVHGQQLLGHELAHVVQQRAGRVRNPLGSGLAVVQDHALEAEADRMGQRAAAHRVAAQAKTAPGMVMPLTPAAAQPSSAIRISAPVSAGPDSYRLSAGSGGREIGSVMVHARDRGRVEVTDLGVDHTQRGRGIGRMLVASAARTGLQFGRSKVTLAAQDRGSGHLTRWYKQMGFAQTGVNRHGYPQLEAPISRVLAGVAQRREKTPRHSAANDPETLQTSPFIGAVPRRSVRVVQRASEAPTNAVPEPTASEISAPFLTEMRNLGLTRNQEDARGGISDEQRALLSKCASKPSITKGYEVKASFLSGLKSASLIHTVIFNTKYEAGLRVIRFVRAAKVQASIVYQDEARAGKYAYDAKWTVPGYVTEKNEAFACSKTELSVLRERLTQAYAKAKWSFDGPWKENENAKISGAQIKVVDSPGVTAALLPFLIKTEFVIVLFREEDGLVLEVGQYEHGREFLP